MIAAGNDLQRARRCQRGKYWLQFVGSAERIAASLNEQHGTTDRSKMAVASFFWPAGRVEREAEQHQTGDGCVRISGRHVRGDTPTHRFAADEQRSTRAGEFGARGRDHLTETRLQQRMLVGQASLLFRVQEVE